jgi:outer membrane protein assembly factor BamA
MQRKLLIFNLVLMLTAFILNSCSNTRVLTGNQLLYTGTKKVTFITDDRSGNQKGASQVIQTVTSYKPNNALLGKRLLPPFGLWIYNYMKPKGKGKLSNWFYKTFSEEPVLLSLVNPDLRCQKLKSELFNIGFFHSTVWANIDTSSRNPRKVKIAYFLRLDQPYRYNSIVFTPPADAVDTLISGFQGDLSIKPEDYFNLETVKSETKRIAALVLEHGYFYFNTNHVQWIADTNVTPYRIDLRVGKRNDLSPEALRKYTIQHITVKIASPDDSSYLSQSADTIYSDGISIVSKYNYLKPVVISRSIYFRNGDLYSSSRHQQTLQRLNSYGVFKFINIQFIPVKDSTVHQLDLMILLTPMKDINLDLEANLVTKSTGFSGPGFEATLAHANLARGSNKLLLKLNGGFEWQWNNHSSSSLGTNSYSIGVTTSVVFPKVLLPFHLANPSHFVLPQTSVNVGFEFMNKIQYYRMNSLNLGLGYQWKKTDKIIHAFYPVYLNAVKLLKTTPEFDTIINGNPYIRKSFEEQFIAGMKYNFIYDNSKQSNGIYFQAGLSAAGNFLDLIKTAVSSEQARPYSTFGNVYSQFIKITTDLRYYRNRIEHSLVFRLYAGVGIPYKNSTVMPYVEQFYSGGTNSIRAFAARTLGPGNYHGDLSSGIIDQTGDIKLEGNIEYRFKMTKMLKGAIFLDAGNVWLLNPDELRPGAEFNFDTFVNQIAVGTGLGLRFDVNFFILRTDVGFPIRRNYVTDGRNWLATPKEVLSGFLLNLAIGYPF